MSYTEETIKKSIENIISMVNDRWNSEDKNDFRDICIHAWKTLNNEDLYKEFLKKSYAIVYGLTSPIIFSLPEWRQVEEVEIRNVKEYCKKED